MDKILNTIEAVLDFAGELFFMSAGVALLALMGCLLIGLAEMVIHF